MSPAYFRILVDMDIEDSWMLGNLNVPDDVAWDEIEKNDYILSQDWTIDVLFDGTPLDITVVDFDLWVVRQEVLQHFKKDEITFKEVRILGGSIDEPFYLLGAKVDIECIDEENSEFELWEENNEIRPDLAGTYKHFSKIRIDRTKIRGASFFRVKGYETAKILSNSMVKKFRAQGIGGVKFEPV
jgi:hypothetical protein